MSVEYQTTYKCRLCGETYVSGCTGTEDTAIKAVAGIVTGQHTSVQHPDLYGLHFCSNGNFGLSDFQGFNKFQKGDS